MVPAYPPDDDAPFGRKPDGSPYKRRPNKKPYPEEAKAKCSAGGKMSARKKGVVVPEKPTFLPGSRRLTALATIKKSMGPDYCLLTRAIEAAEAIRTARLAIQGTDSEAEALRAHIGTQESKSFGALVRYIYPQHKATELSGSVEGLRVTIDMRKKK